MSDINENPDDIFEKTGKNNKMFVGPDKPFYNAQSLIIEYEDVIKSPGFILLCYLSKIETKLDEIIDLKSIKGLSDTEIYEFYINREVKELLLNFPLSNKALENKFNNSIPDMVHYLTNIVYDEIECVPEIINNESFLNFKYILNMMNGDMVDNIFIFTERYSKAIEESLNGLFDKCKPKYVYGNLISIIEKNNISQDSTYVLSDIRHIGAIAESKRLTGSSIILADKYRYNYKDDECTDFIINLEEYYKNFIFKLDAFDNIHNIEFK